MSRTKAEVAAYEHLCYQAQTIFIQVVSSNILEKIVELGSPHKMWTWLRTEYYRDTAYAFVYQITNLTSLSSSYINSDCLASFISKFESVWLKLQKLVRASKDTYHKNFAAFLDEDKAQRDFLLGFLIQHHQNVVDNLTTKDELSFAKVKQRLMDMSSNLEG